MFSFIKTLFNNFTSLWWQEKIKTVAIQEEMKKMVDSKNQTDKELITCALVIGHKKTSPGAYNIDHDIYEFEFNEKIALGIEKRFYDSDIIIQRIYRRTYKSLPNDINELNPDFIISLHCNAFNTKAKGCEVLYYYKSWLGLTMATILQKNLLSIKPDSIESRDRGIVPLTVEDRGGYLLKYTKAPCVIAEPFFIDNSNELEYFLDPINEAALIAAYCKSIEEITKVLAI